MGLGRLSRQNSGWRQVGWRDRLPGAKAEPKKGRGRQPPEVVRERIDDCKAKLRELLFGRQRTFRQLMEALDYYESEIRAALVELGVNKSRIPGFRVPVYTMPAAVGAPSLN